MGIASQTPKNRPVKKKVTWEKIDVEPNSKHHAWMAGPCIGTWVHFQGKYSVPCCNAMSETRLQCSLCAPGNPPVWRGYIPLYDVDYTRRFVVIGEGFYEMATTLEHLQQVIIQRAKNKKDPVQIRPHTFLNRLPSSEERSKPVDLMDFLVGTLWKNDELAKWHFSNYATRVKEEVAASTDTDVSSAVAANIRDGKPSTVRDWMGFAAGESAEETEAAKRNKAFVAAAHAHENGNGRKKPKG